MPLSSDSSNSSISTTPLNNHALPTSERERVMDPDTLTSPADSEEARRLAQSEQRLGTMLGEQYGDTNSLEKACQHLKNALHYWQHAEQPMSEAACWSIFGDMVQRLQRYDEAADAFHQAWKRYANSQQFASAADAADCR